MGQSAQHVLTVTTSGNPRALQRLTQQLSIERLHHISHDAEVLCSFDSRDVADARRNHDTRGGPIVADAFGQPESIYLGHSEINEGDRRRVGAYQLERVEGAGCGHDPVAPLLELPPQKRSY